MPPSKISFIILPIRHQRLRSKNTIKLHLININFHFLMSFILLLFVAVLATTIPHSNRSNIKQTAARNRQKRTTYIFVKIFSSVSETFEIMLKHRRSVRLMFIYVYIYILKPYINFKHWNYRCVLL